MTKIPLYIIANMRHKGHIISLYNLYVELEFFQCIKPIKQKLKTLILENCDCFEL
jgi:hypothetical protein